MLTLKYFADIRPDLRLRWVDPAHARIYGETRITEVTVAVPSANELSPNRFSASGTLVLVNMSSGVSERTDAALNQLIGYLKYCKAAGLVLRMPGPESWVNPGVRARADQFKLPLLTTTADTEWVGVNEFLQQQRATFAERHVEHLEGLLNRMPTQLASAQTVDGIITWLSMALEADVAIGSPEEGVLAAAPDTGFNLARSMVDSSGAEKTTSAEHARLMRIFGAGDNTVLAIVSRDGFDLAAGRLIRHAAKLLGICEQARRDYRSVVLGPRSVSEAATQLLLSAEADKGRIIADTLSHSLMDTDYACVQIIDTGEHDREPILRWCEKNLGGRALVSPTPGKPRRITIITPAHQHETVTSDLRAMVRARTWLVMGESRMSSLPDIGAAHGEAVQALGAAAGSPDRIGGAQTKVASLLPRNAAFMWAHALLGPILQPTHRQLLETLPSGCSLKPLEASRGLGIHRNTLRQRLSRAGRLLGLDLNRINDRVLVLLALDILALPVPEEAAPEQHPEFSELLATENEIVRNWAETRLRPLKSDHRPLLRTLCVWLENDMSARRAAQELGISEATVRHHTSEACALLGVATTAKEVGLKGIDVVTIADVGIAAHVETGAPTLRQPGSHARQTASVKSNK